jgi:hypothetical protein
MSSLSCRAATGVLLLAATTLSACSLPRSTSAVPHAALRPLPAVDASSEVALAQHAAPAEQSMHPRDGDLQAPDAGQPYVTPDRLRHGYTIVVVGVNGDNLPSAGLAPGLVEGGYPGAVEVVDWTTGFWPLFIYHLRADQRHRNYAQLIADKIANYQAHYPGRGVNLVGYSAGAVVAVEALEALGEGRQIDRAVLLAGAISPFYDLRAALARTRQGIVNYYQTQDVVALWAGTTLAGTADGTHLPSAGAVGFWPRLDFGELDRQAYRDKLVQLPFRPQMAWSGNLGGHFQCTGRKFVAQWISPLLAGSPGAPVAQVPRSIH